MSKLQKVMLDKGITLEELCSLTKTSEKTTYARLSRGINSVSLANKIAKQLKVSYIEILEDK